MEEQEKTNWKCRNRDLFLERLEEEEGSVQEIWRDVEKTLHEAAECTKGKKSTRRKRK